MLKTDRNTGLKHSAAQTGDKTPKPNQAAHTEFRKGKAAGRQAKLETDNPIRYTTKKGLAAWWSRGWQEGKR